MRALGLAKSLYFCRSGRLTSLAHFCWGSHLQLYVIKHSIIVFKMLCSESKISSSMMWNVQCSWVSVLMRENICAFKSTVIVSQPIWIWLTAFNKNETEMKSRNSKMQILLLGFQTKNSQTQYSLSAKYCFMRDNDDEAMFYEPEAECIIQLNQGEWIFFTGCKPIPYFSPDDRKNNKYMCIPIITIYEKQQECMPACLSAMPLLVNIVVIQQNGSH